MTLQRVMVSITKKNDTLKNVTKHFEIQPLRTVTLGIMARSKMAFTNRNTYPGECYYGECYGAQKVV